MGLERPKALDPSSRRQKIPLLNLNSRRSLGSPVVAVMQAAQPCLRNHSGEGGGFHSRPINWSLLAQPKMRSVFVVVSNILGEQALQVRLVHRNDVIQQIASTALDPALGNSVLPWAPDRSPNRSHGHRAHRCRDLEAVLGIAIEDQELLSGLIRECFSQLLNDLGARRMPRDVEMQNLPAMMAQDEKAVEHAESHSRHGKEVHGGDNLAMIPQECEPSLGWFGISRGAAHPPRNRSFGDIEAKHQQLSVNPRRTPRWVLGCHPEDQIANLLRDPFPPDRLARA